MIKESTKQMLYPILVVLAIVLVGVVVAIIMLARKKKLNCGKGHEKNGKCICPPGSTGGHCEWCLTGLVPDPATGLCVTPADSTYGCFQGTCQKGHGEATSAQCRAQVCPPPAGPCHNLDCGSHGTCKVVNGTAECDCSGGYSGDNCGTPPGQTVPQMINGAWLQPHHAGNEVTLNKIKGWVTDLMVGYILDVSFPEPPKGQKKCPPIVPSATSNSKYQKLNRNVVAFLNKLKSSDTEMRIWIIIYKGDWSGEIGNEAMDMAKHNKWGKLMSVIADGMGADLMKRFSGIIVDWEKHGHCGTPEKVEPYEVQAMIDIYNQVRAVYPNYGIRINLPNYEECLEKTLKVPSKYQDWCPDGPSDKSYHDFLGLPDAYFDFQSYGSNMNNDYGCKAKYPSNNCFGPDGNCSVSHIDQTLNTRLKFIKCNMCQHVFGSAGKNFLGTMTPAERAKITIGTYPTTPTGLWEIYKKVWRPYGFQGYWMFDVAFISGCDEKLLKKYRDTVQNIKDDLINKPMRPGSIDWKCTSGSGGNQECDTIGK